MAAAMAMRFMGVAPFEFSAYARMQPEGKATIDMPCRFWHFERRATAAEVLPRLRHRARPARGRGPHPPDLPERAVRLDVLRQSGSGRGGAARARPDGPSGAEQRLAGEVVRPRLRVSREGRIARGRRP